jgi:hypothetical protein
MEAGPDYSPGPFSTTYLVPTAARRQRSPDVLAESGGEGPLGNGAEQVLNVPEGASAVRSPWWVGDEDRSKAVSRAHEDASVLGGAPIEHEALIAAPIELNRLAASATNHCLTGCLTGEVTGMAIATALGWGNVASTALAVALAFCSATA